MKLKALCFTSTSLRYLLKVQKLASTLCVKLTGLACQYKSACCTSTPEQILTQQRPQDIIPRQQFKVPIQAKIGEKIVASAQVLTLLALLALLVQRHKYSL